jgi:hypothetical protein
MQWAKVSPGSSGAATIGSTAMQASRLQHGFKPGIPKPPNHLQASQINTLLMIYQPG